MESGETMTGLPDFIIALIILTVLALVTYGIVVVMIHIVLPRAVKNEERRTDPCRTCDSRRARKRVCDGCPIKLRREFEHERRNQDHVSSP